jgi:hypothetical protein
VTKCNFLRRNTQEKLSVEKQVFLLNKFYYLTPRFHKTLNSTNAKKTALQADRNSFFYTNRLLLFNNLKKINMKKLFITALLTAAFVYQSSAMVFISWSKSDKGLFGYRNVSSTFNGFDNSHNQYWTVICSDPGLSKCQQNLGINPGGDPGDDFAIKTGAATLDAMSEEADNNILNGEKNGSINRKIETIDENGDAVWVHVHLTWKTKGGNQYEFDAKLWTTPRIH